MVAIGKDLAFAVHGPIEAPGHADCETLHTPGQSAFVFGFDNEMDVVLLDGVMDQAETKPLCTFGKRTAQCPEELAVSQLWQAVDESKGDVNRVA